MNKASFVALALCAVTSSAFAAPKCDQETTQGAWVYTCEGTVPTPSPTAARLLGRCSAGRTGFFQCEGNINVGGTVAPNVLHGQANTAQNCTGRIVYSQTVGGQPAPPLDIQYVISEKGNAIDGLPTNTGGVLSFRLVRLDAD